MNMSERIAHALSASGRPPSELSKEIGISVARISQLKSGSGGIKAENLFPLARATGFTPEWLAEGVGDPRSSLTPDQDPIFLPLLDRSGQTIGTKGSQRPLALDRRWLAAVERDEKTLRYFGEHSGYAHNSYVVDISKTVPVDQGVFLIRRADGALVVKRMIRTMSSGWILQSRYANTRHYPDEMVSEDDLATLDIAGKVVWQGGPVE